MAAVLSRGRFARLLALALAPGLTGCSAHCLRDSDCDDTQVCVRDACVRPSLAEDASAGGAAGQAGGQGLINPSYPGMGGAGGVGGAAMTPEQGGAAGTGASQGGSAGTAASFGGSATLPREILDASADADADADAS